MLYCVTLVPVAEASVNGWAQHGFTVEAANLSEAKAKAQTFCADTWPQRQVKTVRRAVNQRRDYWRSMWAKASKRCGSNAELARRLGYVLKNGNHVGRPDNYGMFNRLRYGPKPRDPRKALKLIALAG